MIEITLPAEEPSHVVSFWRQVAFAWLGIIAGTIVGYAVILGVADRFLPEELVVFGSILLLMFHAAGAAIGAYFWNGRQFSWPGSLFGAIVGAGVAQIISSGIPSDTFVLTYEIPRFLCYSCVALWAVVGSRWRAIAQQ